MADEIRPIVLFFVESGATEMRKRVFGPRSLVLESVVPYESGARRIASNLGSDLFCPFCSVSSGVGPSGREELLRWPSVVHHWLVPWLWSLSVECGGGRGDFSQSEAGRVSAHYGALWAPSIILVAYRVGL